MCNALVAVRIAVLRVKNLSMPNVLGGIMKQQEVQLDGAKIINAKLDSITKLLSTIASELSELSDAGTEIKLSRKARAEIEKGLRELESGKGRTYKNWNAFDKKSR